MSYRPFTTKELREAIRLYTEEKKNYGEIAKLLCRNEITISKHLNNNGCPKRNRLTMDVPADKIEKIHSMLIDKLPMSTICEYTRLDESTVRRVQMSLRKHDKRVFLRHIPKHDISAISARLKEVAVKEAAKEFNLSLSSLYRIKRKYINV